MSATINTPICVVGGANTGIPACAMAPDKFVGAILIPRSKTFTDVEAADIIAELQELCLAAASPLPTRRATMGTLHCGRARSASTSRLANSLRSVMPAKTFTSTTRTSGAA